MKIGTFIQTLNNWLEDGTFNKDDNVYVTTGMLNFDESQMFDATFNASRDPNFDKENQIKQALIIGCLDRIPNQSIKGQDYKEYGTDYETLYFNRDISKDEIELEIALNQQKNLNYVIKSLKEKIQKSKNSNNVISNNI